MSARTTHVAAGDEGRWATVRQAVRLSTRRTLARHTARFLKPGQEHRRSQFAALGVPPGRVVFLGASIVEFGQWDEWFPHTPVLNRGIGGETSADVLRRLDTAINAPAAVFLLVGANDLSSGTPPEETTDNVREIVAGIRARAPEARVFVQSATPRTAAYRDELVQLNRGYEAVAAACDSRVRYLDLWPALAAPDGTLRREFTRDNLHLNGDGYRAWVEVLRPHIDAIATPTASDG